MPQLLVRLAEISSAVLAKKKSGLYMSLPTSNYLQRLPDPLPIVVGFRKLVQKRVPLEPQQQNPSR